MIRILCPPGQVLTGIAGILGSSENTTGVMPRCGVPAGFSVKDYTEHDIPESSDIDHLACDADSVAIGFFWSAMDNVIPTLHHTTVLGVHDKLKSPDRRWKILVK